MTQGPGQPYGAIPPPPPHAPPPPYPRPGHTPPPGYGPPGFLPPAPKKSRALPVVLAVVAAVFVLATAIIVPLLLSADDEGDRAGDRDAGDEPTADTSNLDKVAVYDDLDPTHVPEGQDVDYPQSPAVGGNHAPVWLECGVYDEPLPEEYVVHDLEHGTIWITYRPDDVGADGVARLEEQRPDNGILSPYPDQDAPVVITAWGRQLELTGPGDPRIGLFVAEYAAGETAPEPFASCHGGRDPAELSGGEDRSA